MLKDRLEVINKRYETIKEMLLDMNIVSDVKKLTELAKEQKSLEKTVEKYHELLATEDAIAEAKEHAMLQTIVQLHDRFGKNSIVRGRDFEECATLRAR